MNKTALQMFEERNEKACCLNCEKLIVKHTKTGHINFCGESEKIILDMFLDTGTNFSGCKYARKESESGYACKYYEIIGNVNNLSDHDCAIIADGGNLCFGYRMEGQKIVVYTD